jgi:hypothetical protein
VLRLGDLIGEVSSLLPDETVGLVAEGALALSDDDWPAFARLAGKLVRRLSPGFALSLARDAAAGPEDPRAISRALKAYPGSPEILAVVADVARAFFAGGGPVLPEMVDFAVKILPVLQGDARAAAIAILAPHFASVPEMVDVIRVIAEIEDPDAFPGMFEIAIASFEAPGSDRELHSAIEAIEAFVSRGWPQAVEYVVHAWQTFVALMQGEDDPRPRAIREVIACLLIQVVAIVGGGGIAWEEVAHMLSWFPFTKAVQMVKRCLGRVVEMAQSGTEVQLAAIVAIMRLLVALPQTVKRYRIPQGEWIALEDCFYGLAREITMETIAENIGIVDREFAEGWQNELPIRQKIEVLMNGVAERRG